MRPDRLDWNEKREILERLSGELDLKARSPEARALRMALRLADLSFDLQAAIDAMDARRLKGLVR